jgi:hypothetical protein
LSILAHPSMLPSSQNKLRPAELVTHFPANLCRPLTKEEVDALGGTERQANAASLLALCLLDGSKYDALNNVLGAMEKVQDSWWYQTTDCK